MKNIILITFLITTSLSFSQTLKGNNTRKKFTYSENSELSVSYRNSLENNSKKKPIGIFVNDSFISEESLSAINAKKIESITVKKVNFEINDRKYYGKILIKMKDDYEPRFISLEALSVKYLSLNENPRIYKVDDRIVEQEYSSCLIDENFVLKIIVYKIKTSKKTTDINLIKLITKTKENIHEANKVMLRGTEI